MQLLNVRVMACLQFECPFFTYLFVSCSHESVLYCCLANQRHGRQGRQGVNNQMHTMQWRRRGTSDVTLSFSFLDISRATHACIYAFRKRRPWVGLCNIRQHVASVLGADRSSRTLARFDRRSIPVLILPISLTASCTCLVFSNVLVFMNACVL